ncbi:hypothetical protein SCHPADRAFT_999416 [Schizopora paradoxa]|uniref:Uncharacterized protein n=1 Tax=Schizopora paradoxa TaxID=27342 RepID=A0A0H2RGF1_9AGAM|nr:hypothetical protein SCHPADRAFT_999416 [Schizopora paradoxa]
MCEPRWVYGLPIDIDRLYEFAIEKAPECVYEDEHSMTAIEVMEKYGYMLDEPLGMQVGFNVFDEKLEENLVLVLHNDTFEFSKLCLEDENFLRKELGIKEKGKWYRCYSSFSEDMVDYYKERVRELGTIPSRTSTPLDSEKSGSSDGSKVCTECGGSGRLPA